MSARHQFQGLHVSDPFAGRGDGEFITAHFPFQADLPRNPPHRRMVEQQSLHQPLNEIDPQIPTADVRQLMRNDGFEHTRREFGHPGERQQYDGPPETDCRGFRDAAGREDPPCRRNSQSLSDPSRPPGQIARNFDSLASQSQGFEIAAQQPQPQKGHPAEPCQQQIWLQLSQVAQIQIRGTRRLCGDYSGRRESSLPFRHHHHLRSG